MAVNLSGKSEQEKKKLWRQRQRQKNAARAQRRKVIGESFAQRGAVEHEMQQRARQTNQAARLQEKKTGRTMPRVDMPGPDAVRSEALRRARQQHGGLAQPVASPDGGRARGESLAAYAQRQRQIQATMMNRGGAGYQAQTAAAQQRIESGLGGQVGAPTPAQARSLAWQEAGRELDAQPTPLAADIHQLDPAQLQPGEVYQQPDGQMVRWDGQRAAPVMIDPETGQAVDPMADAKQKAAENNYLFTTEQERERAAIDRKIAEVQSLDSMGEQEKEDAIRQLEAKKLGIRPTQPKEPEPWEQAQQEYQARIEQIRADANLPDEEKPALIQQLARNHYGVEAPEAPAQPDPGPQNWREMVRQERGGWERYRNEAAQALATGETPPTQQEILAKAQELAEQEYAFLYGGEGGAAQPPPADAAARPEQLPAPPEPTAEDPYGVQIEPLGDRDDPVAPREARARAGGQTITWIMRPAKLENKFALAHELQTAIRMHATRGDAPEGAKDAVIAMFARQTGQSEKALRKLAADDRFDPQFIPDREEELKHHQMYVFTPGGEPWMWSRHSRTFLPPEEAIKELAPENR